ncbi:MULTISPECIES: RNA-directed DNA polymerase [unclassified Acidovorax]|uniref:RNA-directed DNA polymerase n=1 Tax=unclassified Acidovorax TaxID=2684926 RepID=UPI000C3D849C|nr:MULTISPECIES: RNA-directed DNA polymerase [unclassified Acidovorax]PIF18651.1 reverse transcriptase (RNA-dependent DNA polymerase) [Acidovorax sp. 59]PKW02322.1 reverse transcriptase (RNA-dependent DNA polymerase) [Acidovorax sp. 30]
MPPRSDDERTEILAFPIDVDVVLQHLHRDMRDDWFEDALQHRDLFSSKTSLREVLHEVLLEGNGRYGASKRNVCDIPKKGLGVRYALETDFYDRFIYQAICSYLIPFYDPLLSHRVLGHRYDKRQRTGKDLFKGRIELWQTFEGVTRTALHNNQALFATDLINYFENITTESIREAFEAMLPKITASGPQKVLIRNSINTLCELMTYWGYSERHGLPQNRDASSFIANVVLNTVDQEMVRLGFDYYRYVDDIRIICDSPRAARHAATLLIGQLRTVGMNINSSKTKILTADSPTSDVNEFFPGSDDRSITIDNMWRSRSRRVIIRSTKYIFQLLQECIDSKQTQSRQFRFAVNRLIRLVDAGIFDVRGEMAEKLKSLLIDSLEDHAVSTDQYCRLLSILELVPAELGRIEQFLCDHERAIHSWQNYHLWLTLARVRFKTQKLVALATQRIQDNVLKPEVAAIFIYLRCVGEVSVLEGFAVSFRSNWPYYHQRNYLLATSDSSREFLKPVIAQLGIKLKGTVNRARSHFVENIPLVERERTPMPKMYDELSPYD